MPFADSTTDKNLELGWAHQGDLDQFYQRLTKNLRQLNAMVHNQFAVDRKGSFGLRLSVFGGSVDTDPTWTIVGTQVAILTDNEVNFVERQTGGLIQVVLSDFSTPEFWLPIAQVTTRNGEIIEVLDRRPELGGAGGAGGGGAPITFAQIIGQILNGQVPLSAVKQYLTKTHLPASIAYEDEANDFGANQQTIENLNAPNFEALMRFVSHG